MLNKLGVIAPRKEIEQAIIASLLIKKDRFHSDIKDNKAGWWGNCFEEEKLGSFLWTFERSILNTETIEEIKRYALESLIWLKENGILNFIDVKASSEGNLINLEVICH